MNRPMTASSRDVLIVDDDVYVVKALERVLRPYCSHVFTAISGEQALAILQCQTVIAIVADMLCPPVSGIDVFRTAKHSHIATFTLMLSGKCDIGDIRRAMHEGIVDGFLSKPWDSKDVIAAVHDKLAHCHAACCVNPYSV
jgi:response regulator RpfG family c-di-GMP phosphodiesterase